MSNRFFIYQNSNLGNGSVKEKEGETTEERELIRFLENETNEERAREKIIFYLSNISWVFRREVLLRINNKTQKNKNNLYLKKLINELYNTAT